MSFEVEAIDDGKEQNLFDQLINKKSDDVPIETIIELLKKDEFLEIFDNLAMPARIGIIKALEKIEDPENSKDDDDYEMFTRTLLGHVDEET